MFAQLFAPVRAKLTVVPGNHDRQSDDVAAVFSRGALWVREGCSGALRLVCLDSTQPMNVVGFAAHGQLELDVVDRAVGAAVTAPGQSVLVLIHHHLVRAAPDNLLELFSDLKRLPFTDCLRHGEWLAEQLAGRCAAVLHGHKHRENVLFATGALGTRLPILNAGSTTELERFHVLVLHDNRIVDEAWVRF